MAALRAGRRPIRLRASVFGGRFGAHHAAVQGRGSQHRDPERAQPGLETRRRAARRGRTGAAGHLPRRAAPRRRLRRAPVAHRAVDGPAETGWEAAATAGRRRGPDLRPDDRIPLRRERHRAGGRVARPAGHPGATRLGARRCLDPRPGGPGVHRAHRRRTLVCRSGFGVATGAPGLQRPVGGDHRAGAGRGTADPARRFRRVARRRAAHRPANRSPPSAFAVPGPGTSGREQTQKPPMRGVSRGFCVCSRGKSGVTAGCSCGGRGAPAPGPAPR